MLFPIFPFLSSKIILFIGLLIHCRGFINIPVHNSREWSISASAMIFASYLYHSSSGLSPGANTSSLWWSVNHLSFLYFPVETDWRLGLLGRLWYWVISFQMDSLKPNRMYFLLLERIFNIVGFTFLLFLFVCFIFHKAQQIFIYPIGTNFLFGLLAGTVRSQ